MKPIAIAPAAQAELSAAAAWYEARATGVGEKFLMRVDDAIKRISEHPSSFPVWAAAPRFRKVVTEKFPYVVFYRDTSERIEIVAIAHGSRLPGFWLKR